MLEQAATTPAAAVWHGYPGIAYAQALALRADEMAKKHGVHHESESALADAMKTFPQVIIPLADKIGASIPGSARSHPLLKLEAGYSETPQNVIHLLSHIYVSRSEALWKEPDLVKFFENAVKAALAEIDSSSAKDMRDDALAMVQTPRDPVDEEINVPLFICRHVVCSESTSWLGFLPPVIRNRPVNAFDPLPPSTSITDYDADYFSGAKPSRRRGGPESAAGGRAGLMEGFMERLTGAMEGGGEGWQERVAEVWRDLTGRREFAGMPQGERDGVLEQVSAVKRSLPFDNVLTNYAAVAIRWPVDRRPETSWWRGNARRLPRWRGRPVGRRGDLCRPRWLRDCGSCITDTVMSRCCTCTTRLHTLCICNPRMTY